MLLVEGSEGWANRIRHALPLWATHLGWKFAACWSEMLYPIGLRSYFQPDAGQMFSTSDVHQQSIFPHLNVCQKTAPFILSWRAFEILML